MSETKPRYFVAKPQKGGSILHYWQPSAALTRAGFKTVPLSRNRAEAIQQANALNQKVDQWRGGQPVLAQNTHGTIPWLIEQYKKSPKYSKLRDATKASGQSHFRWILRWSAERGHPPIRTIKRADAVAVWNRIHYNEGHPTYAQEIIGKCRQLWNYALEDLEDQDIVDRNPFARMGLGKVPPRTEVWQPDQIAAVIETALAIPRSQGGPKGKEKIIGYGYPSIAMAILVAVNTAQREGDILDLRASQYNGKTITLTQSKTGALLEIPCTKELKRALDDYLSGGGADGKVVALRPPADRHLLLNENTGVRWLRARFGYHFREICNAAGIPSNMQFRDLRRTATVQLAEAGCEVPEIAAIGGWTIKSVYNMLKVYCPLNLTMAQNAVVKLENYRAAGTLEG